MLKNKDYNFENKLLIGRNSIKEALVANRTIDSILIAAGDRNGSIHTIIQQAKFKNIPIKYVDIRKLDTICKSKNHQGIIATVAAYKYSSVNEILSVADKKNEPPFIIIADEITDPHNLGAILRTAECSGAHGVIIPKRRAVGLTSTVSKSAAGALEHIKVARVNNIAKIIDDLKSKGIWIYGADINGDVYCTVNLRGALAIVIGSEGFGISRLVKEKCDFTLSLPLCGKINSLNASVAAGILMYEVQRQRLNLNNS